MARKKTYPVATQEKGVNLIEEDFLPPIHHPKQLDDDLQLAPATLPGEQLPEDDAKVEETPQSELPAEPPELEPEIPAQASEEKNSPALPYVLELALSALTKGNLDAKDLYTKITSEIEKIEEKINKLKGELIAKREARDVLDEHFSILRVAKEKMEDYAQLSLGLVWDDEKLEPRKEKKAWQDGPVPGSEPTPKDEEPELPLNFEEGEKAPENAEEVEVQEELNGDTSEVVFDEDSDDVPF